MTALHPRENPFSSDPDRSTIWDMLVRRDIAAFLRRDWEAVADTFDAASFVGYLGSANPDHWTIRFPTLPAYRDDWLRQGAEFSALTFGNQTHEDVLYRATLLQHIEITGEHAAAHKKFYHQTSTADGTPFALDWQTIYWLRKRDGHWRITGFLGYLPHGSLGFTAGATAPRADKALTLPEGASQHKGAGPYSPALSVRSGRFLVLSGQGPLDTDGQIIGTTIEEQTVVTLKNCQRLLNDAGANFSDVFRCMVYLSDMGNWDRFNVVYRRYFSEPFPARTAIQAVLWGGIQVEIEMSATLS
jgi:enamine deaminase RidA (YjgF/YER057c/UK114 family)